MKAIPLDSLTIDGRRDCQPGECRLVRLVGDQWQGVTQVALLGWDRSKIDPARPDVNLGVYACRLGAHSGGSWHLIVGPVPESILTLDQADELALSDSLGEPGLIA